MVRLIVSCLALLLLTGCGVARLAKRDDYKLSESTSIPAPAPGQASVCFLRESAFTGGGVTFFVFDENNKAVGVSDSGSYFCIDAVPGEHVYWGEAYAIKPSILISAQPDKQYFVSFFFTPLSSDWHMVPIPEAKARAEIPGLKKISLTRPVSADEFK